MILTMFLNALTRDALNRQRAPSFDPEFLRLLWDNRVNSRVLLLVPLTLFNGIGKAFVHGVFTKSFVACGMGVQQIGFIGAAFGLSDAVCSLVFGPLIKLFGRMPLFVFGAVVNLLMILTLMVIVLFLKSRETSDLAVESSRHGHLLRGGLGLGDGRRRLEYSDQW